MAQLINGNGYPLIAQKILPNAPCPCGSGKKAKKCCGTETQLFYSKLTKSQRFEQELLEARRKADAEKRAEAEKMNEPASVE